jgi:hypothetical protein
MNVSYNEMGGIIENAVAKGFEKVLLKYGLLNNIEKPKELIYVPVKIVCDELKVSKTTIYNWRKNKLTKLLIEPHIKLTGKRVYFDLEGLKKTLRKDGFYFSNGRGYKYRDEILTDEQKKIRTIAEINSKVEFEEELTESEKEFYEGNLAENESKDDGDIDDF